jgi:hypothetical protein
MTFEIDLNEFSRQLADLVSESLERAGAAIGPAGKGVAVEVVYLDFMFQGPCYVDYTVELGNGEVFGQQATGESSNFTTGCTRALETAVKQIIGDVRTGRYLGGP